MSRLTSLVLLVAVLAVSLTAPAVATDADYSNFSDFCKDNFGAELEPLIYEVQGNTLTFVSTGAWRHESMNSAAVAFETNLPANTRIEYGTTASYGNSTEVADRPYYLHVHHLDGLSPNTTYHYRLVATDERDNTITSGDQTLRTQVPAGAVFVPGSMGAPPYVLNQANTNYVLTEDIVSNTRGITIAASGITLDMNGFTVSYDNGPSLVSGNWADHLYSDISTYGVYVNSNVSATVLNGKIVQGSQQSTGQLGLAFCPIMIRSGPVEVAGVVQEYGGSSISGLVSRGLGNRLHHNVVIDKGTEIENRHQGIRAYDCSGGDEEIAYNLVRRARHQGVMNGGWVHDNEMYFDSWGTNAIGISPKADHVVARNKLFGTGYHLVAIGWALVDYCDSVVVRDNLIFLQGDAPFPRSPEYGPLCSLNGLRLSQYNGSSRQYNNYLYEGNTIIVKGRNNTTTMRGTQFYSDPYVENLIFRNNIIKTEVQDNNTSSPASCVVAHGQEARHDTQLPVLYSNNRFITNSLFVNFGDTYAGGGNHQFKNSSFEKFGSRSDYVTLNVGFYNFHSYKNLFIDCEVSGGADLEDNAFDGDAEAIFGYSVGHEYYIVARDSEGGIISHRTVMVQDLRGVTFTGTTNASGVARLELIEYEYFEDAGESSPERIQHEGHAIAIPGYHAVAIGATEFAIRRNSDNPVEYTFTAASGEMPGQPTGLEIGLVQ